jgi:hypothetical protein
MKGSSKDNSFLDPKLLSNLAKSYRIQSQLKIPLTRDIGESRSKLVIVDEGSVQINQIVSFQKLSSNPTIQMLFLIKSIVENQNIELILSEFLGKDNREKLNLILTIKVPRNVRSNPRQKLRR